MLCWAMQRRLGQTFRPDRSAGMVPAQDRRDAINLFMLHRALRGGS
jgi:hypothetical protein